MAKNAPETTTPAKTDFSPALNATQNQLDLTFSASDSLDSKALAVLGFVIALSIFALQSEMHNTLWLRLPMFAIFGLSAVLAIITIWPRRYEGAVVDLQQHPEYATFSYELLVLKLLANTQQAVRVNTALNTRKSTLCALAIATSLIGVGFLIGCIL